MRHNLTSQAYRNGTQETVFYHSLYKIPAGFSTFITNVIIPSTYLSFELPRRKGQARVTQLKFDELGMCMSVGKSGHDGSGLHYVCGPRPRVVHRRQDPDLFHPRFLSVLFRSDGGGSPKAQGLFDGESSLPLTVQHAAGIQAAFGHHHD